MAGATKSTAVQVIGERIERQHATIQMLLPEGQDAMRLVRQAQMMLAHNSGLASCTPKSITLAVLRLAQFGLELGITAHIIPYGSEAVLVIDYKGLVELAMRTGLIESVSAYVVHEGDPHFEVRYGTEPRIDHMPSLDADPGEAIGCYAVAKLPSGGTIFTYLRLDEIEAVRNGKGGPWQTHWGEMAKKTAIRRLCKLLPTNPTYHAATVLQDRGEGYTTGPNEVLDRAEVALEVAFEEDEEAGEQDQPITHARGTR